MQKAEAQSTAEPSKDQSAAFSPKEGWAWKKGTGADTENSAQDRVGTAAAPLGRLQPWRTSSTGRFGCRWARDFSLFPTFTQELSSD